MTPYDGEPEVRCRRLDPANIPQPLLRHAYEYWESKRGTRRAPSRGDIDPADLRYALPSTLLIDVARDPWRFSYRLAGTLTERIHGVELTGRAIDSLKPQAFADMLRADLIELAERAEPQFVYLEFINQMGVPRGYHVLRLPLAGDGSTVDMVLVISDYGADSNGLQKFLAAMKAR